MPDANSSLVALSVAIAASALLTAVRTYLFERTATATVKEAETKAETAPEKAKPAWDLARTTLELYFKRNLEQIGQIFWLSLVVMLLGFGVVIWGIVQAVQSPAAVAIAAIATAAGIVTQFIGATFLFIYRSTIEQAAGYTKTLERINTVGMATQILDAIPDDAADDLKNKTRARLVESLAKLGTGHPAS